ncbi:hypothetical protein O0L34_g5873 [Tuta absoluta]|nr:hypothetical protein O0L34_g5873 [Tuta absoluta]
MKQWQITVCCVVMCFGSKNPRGQELNLLPGKNILSIIPEFWGQSPTPTAGATVPDMSTLPEISKSDISVPEMKESGVETMDQEHAQTSLEMTTTETFTTFYDTSAQPDLHGVVHAGKPLDLKAVAIQVDKHQLALNVSWLPSLGPPAEDYSLEVTSTMQTEDCKLPICYEYNIPGDSVSHIIPQVTTPVAETCAIHPGCKYQVVLKAHPWDGTTKAETEVPLNECEAGVCSCAHSPRLPTPVVRAKTLSINGQIVTNITWYLPPPSFPLRLPKGLQKKLYFVSISKQMVSDAHPSPWYGYTAKREVEINGPVAAGDDVRWAIVPIDERSGQSVARSGEPGKPRSIMLDVKLLARVSLVDDRDCVGPAGNATAYDPTEAHKTRIGTYALWAVFGGACVLAMGAILAVSARAVKRLLNALRPAPVSAPLEPLRRRPAWFPMQIR